MVSRFCPETQKALEIVDDDEDGSTIKHRPPCHDHAEVNRPYRVAQNKPAWRDRTWTITHVCLECVIIYYYYHHYYYYYNYCCALCNITLAAWSWHWRPWLLSCYCWTPQVSCHHHMTTVARLRRRKPNRRGRTEQRHDEFVPAAWSWHWRPWLLGSNRWTPQASCCQNSNSSTGCLQPEEEECVWERCSKWEEDKWLLSCYCWTPQVSCCQSSSSGTGCLQQEKEAWLEEEGE